MSTGGAFSMITNTGIQDAMIMATDKLRDRLRILTEERLQIVKKENPKLSTQQALTSALPTLADIEQTHILFVNSTFKPFVSVNSLYTKTTPRGGNQPQLGSTIQFTIPSFGDFINEGVVYIKLQNFAAISPANKVRYFEMLGHRLLKKTSFMVKQNVLDSYNSDKYNIHWQYKVPPGKEIGYMRNIGQEVPVVGHLTANPSNDEVREYKYFGNGPQTFKTIQPTLELWIPLLFWFKDVECSLPQFMFTRGESEIQIELEKEDNIVAFANYNNATGKIYTSPQITDCAIYFNHLVILPEIFKIFVRKFSLQLIRVNRMQQISVLRTSSDNILLNAIRWPVEVLYVAFKPQSNLYSSSKWHRNTVITTKTVTEPVVSINNTVEQNDASFLHEVPVISNLEIKAHDIVIFPSNTPEFYNSYMSYARGDFLKTPKDLGWNVFYFNLKPGQQQPSGHLNVSQERELRLQYNSAVDSVTNLPYIRDDNPVGLSVYAECINFLLMRNNTGVLRFNT